MTELARVADGAGFGALWVTDHFSGAVVDAPWSRDPFVCLGALAAATERVDVGLLVGNINSRHPVQFASAANSLQSLAPGRVRMGVGSGAAPGSRFAVEFDMIGARLGDTRARRRRLREYIGALRAIWAGDERHAAETAGFTGLRGVVDRAVMPQLIVGASAWPTIEVAVELADGVNIRRTAALDEQLALLADADLPDGFEISVLEPYAADDPFGHRADELRAAGVHRRIVTVSAERDHDLVAGGPPR